MSEKSFQVKEVKIYDKENGEVLMRFETAEVEWKLSQYKEARNGASACD